MSLIKVNYAALETAAQNLKQTRNELGTQLQDFKATTDTMVATMEGAEVAAYEATKARTQQTFDALSLFVEDVANRVLAHAENTRATDARQAAKWA